MALAKQAKHRMIRNRLRRQGSAWQRKAESQVYRALEVTRIKSYDVATAIMALPGNDKQLPALQAKYHQLYEEWFIQHKAVRLVWTLSRAEWLKIKHNPCFWHDMGIGLEDELTVLVGRGLTKHKHPLSDIHWTHVTN